jgi:FkbM family methyltransferase
MDIGSRDGYFALLFSNLAGRVHAFEPTDHIDALQKNIEYYNIKNIFTHKVAVGNKVGSVKDIIYKNWPTPEESIYNFIRLDDFPTDRLDLIKIDVDSFEEEVIDGAISTLKKFRPIIIIELNDVAVKSRGSSKDGIINKIISLGYNHSGVLDHENHIFTPH